MSALWLILGFFFGMLATIVNVLMQDRALTGREMTTYIIGGGLGGLICVLILSPTDEIGRSTILLITLSGYFGADLFSAFIRGRR